MAASGDRGMDLTKAQTPLGVGRAIAALTSATDVMERSGQVQWIEDLSVQFDTRDENGNLAVKYHGRQS